MIDKTNIRIIAGAGGNGCVSFRREKYVPKGGPDGGDGGHGGNIFIIGDSSLTTLTHLTSRSVWKAPKGTHGKGKKKYGAAGNDIFIQVPIGTLIQKHSCVYGHISSIDVTSINPIMVAKGGHGGRGNAKFVSSINREPMLAQTGEQGEDVTLCMELKLIADVGIIGKPNAGKSTLITQCSAAKPKIASYPFTTTEPVLGVVERNYSTFLIMEIPGLVQDAHKGVGLGHEFLRHAERARVYIHLIDGLSEDPAEDLLMINNELSSYGKGLILKPQIIAINKTDIPEVRTKTKRVEMEYREGWHGPIYISAATGDGVEELVRITMEVLKNNPRTVKGEGTEQVLPTIGAKKETFSVDLEGNVYHIRSTKLERIVPLVDMRDRRSLAQIWKEIYKMGIADILKKKGIKEGHTVKIGDVELEWF